MNANGLSPARFSVPLQTPRTAADAPSCVPLCKASPDELRVRFASVLKFTRAEYRVFVLLGQGKTVHQIAEVEGKKVTKSTIWCQVGALKQWTGKSLMELIVFAAAYRESGLQREVNEDYAPYKFKP